MAKKEDLLLKADELQIPGLDPDMSTKELETAITDFEENKALEEAIALEDAEAAEAENAELDQDQVPAPPKGNIDCKYYRSRFSGMTVPLKQPKKRSELFSEVPFKPVEHWDERRGDHYKLGYLATDEPNANDILDNDINVQEITWEQYWLATEKGIYK